MLLACLATTVAWADDWSFAPQQPQLNQPPPRQATPQRPRSAGGRPTAKVQSYNQPPSGMASARSLSQPASIAENDQPSAPEEVPAGDSNSNISPEEMFPSSYPDPYEMNSAPVLPMPGWMNGVYGSGDNDDPDRPQPGGITLSSGRWFQRGCWYVQEEATYLMRSERGRFKRFLAGEFDPQIQEQNANTGAQATANNQTPPSSEFVYIATSITSFSNPIQFSLPLSPSNNTLAILPSLGFAPGARMTIGRNLGTDAMNRQSSIEFTFQGLNHWSDQHSINSLLPFENTLFTSFAVIPATTSIPTAGPLNSSLGNAAPGFAYASVMQYTYNASLNSYELNFKLSNRSGRDRSVLTREGVWARVVTPQFLPAIYGGLRLINYNEGFIWRSTGLNPSTINGTYDIATQNYMFGPQLGSSITYQHQGWKFTGRLAGGTLLNFANQHSNIAGFDTFSNNIVVRNDSNQNTTLSLLFDFGINTTYYFRPNMGLRLGYQIFMMSNLALAERQVTFQNFNPPILNQDHGLYFQGISGGFEMAW